MDIEAGSRRLPVGRAGYFPDRKPPREGETKTSTPSPNAAAAEMSSRSAERRTSDHWRLDGLVAVGLQPVRGPERTRRGCTPRRLAQTDCTEPSPSVTRVVQRPQCLVDSNVSVLHVHLVEVDHVRLQAAKRIPRKPVMIAWAREGPHSFGPRFVASSRSRGGKRQFSCNEAVGPACRLPTSPVSSSLRPSV